MGSWVTKAYTFVESSGSYSVVTTNLTGKFLTAKLTKNLGDTAKFNFSLPYADGKDLFPLKTYIDVVYQNDAGVYPTSEGMIKGAITKRSYSAVDGVFTFESCGVLGMYQFIPPYRNYGVVSIQEYIDTEQKRFRGIASSPYACDNPHTELLDNSGGLFGDYGRIAVGDYSAENTQYKPAFNLSIQKTAKNSYEFLKHITKQGNYVFPPYYQTFLPPLYREYYDYVQWFPVAGVNTQAVRYDTNLLSCSIDDIPYKTEISASANGVSYSEKSSEYPNPFYYSDESLNDKTDGTPYTQNDISNYVKTALNDEKVVVDAIGFDYHFVDNTVPLLDIYQFVDLTYWDGSAERTVRAQITQITYDLLNPANDRVKMGKVQETITSQISGDTTEILDETVKGYLSLEGGTMQGDINIKDSSSVLSDTKLSVRDRIFGTCNLIDMASLEQGYLDYNGAETASTTQLRSGWTKVSASTTYTLSYTASSVGAMARFYNSSKAHIGDAYNLSSGSSFTTVANTAYVRFVFGYSNSATILPSAVSNLQLEKGSSASSYVPYAMDNVELTEMCTYQKKTLTPNIPSFSGYGGCFWERIGMLKHLHVAVENSSAMTSWTSIFSAGVISGLNRGWAFDIRGVAGSPQNNASMRIFNDGSISVMSGDKWGFFDYWYI